jgi:EmrB/QacA subfamily drug resistance transporter
MIFSESTSTAVATQHAKRWWALSVLVVAELVVLLDSSIMSITLPAAQQTLGVSDVDRQWGMTSYTLTFGSLLLLGGRIADFTGRKRAFIIGLTGFAVSSAVRCVATDGVTFFTSRALQGAFSALLLPAALSLITVTFTDGKERAKAFGVYGAITGTGAAIGLLAGGMLTHYTSWRWCMAVVTPIALIAVFPAVVLLEESRATGDTRYDPLGALTAIVGFGALVYGFAVVPEHGWTSTMTVGYFLLALVSLAAFTLIQHRGNHPLLPLRVLADRNRAGALLSVMLSSIGAVGIFILLSFYLQSTLGYSILACGVAFLPFSFGLITSAILAGRLLPKIGARPMMVGGLLINAVSLVMLTQIGTDTSYLTHVLPALIIMSIGFGPQITAASATALGSVPEHDGGVAGAVFSTALAIGSSVGAALLNTVATSATASYLTHHDGTIAQSTVHGYQIAFWCEACITTAAAVLTAIIVKKGTSSDPFKLSNFLRLSGTRTAVHSALATRRQVVRESARPRRPRPTRRRQR